MELIEKNKVLVQRYVAAYNRHDLEAMDTILAPLYIDHAQSYAVYPGSSRS